MKKTNASWGGRFKQGPAEAVAAYTESESYDRYLALRLMPACWPARALSAGKTLTLL